MCRHGGQLLLTAEHRGAPAPEPIYLALAADGEVHLGVTAAEEDGGRRDVDVHLSASRRSAWKRSGTHPVPSRAPSCARGVACVFSATGDRIRARAAGPHPVLLIPTAVYDASELAKAVLGKALPSRGRVIRGVIAASGLTDVVHAVFTAPENTRLVVDTRIGKVWSPRGFVHAAWDMVR